MHWRHDIDVYLHWHRTTQDNLFLLFVPLQCGNVAEEITHQSLLREQDIYDLCSLDGTSQRNLRRHTWKVGFFQEERGLNGNSICTSGLE